MDLDTLFSQLAISAAAVVGKGALSAVGQFAMVEVKEVIKKHRKKVAKHEEFYDATSLENEPAANSDLEKKWSQIEQLQWRLQFALGMIAPSMEYCEMRAAQGNTVLSRALSMAAPLRQKIADLSAKVKIALKEPESEQSVADDLLIQMTSILETINFIVPYMNLAISASNVSLQKDLGNNFSISRLLQASQILRNDKPILFHLQVKLYSLFDASSRNKQYADWTWKLEFAKAHCFLVKSSTTVESLFAYKMIFVEDLNSGHATSCEPVPLSGEYAFLGEYLSNLGTNVMPSRIAEYTLSDLLIVYYSMSGHLLRIEDSNSPVLILKCNTIRNVRDQAGNSEQKQLSCYNKASWIAFEVLHDNDLSSDSEPSFSDDDGRKKGTKLRSRKPAGSTKATVQKPSGLESITLSLVDAALRLAAMEALENCSHLDMTDERLHLYIEQFSGLAANSGMDRVELSKSVPSNLSTPSGDVLHPAANSALLTTPTSTRVSGSRTNALNQPLLSPKVPKSGRATRTSREQVESASESSKTFLEKLKAGNY